MAACSSRRRNGAFTALAPSPAERVTLATLPPMHLVQLFLPLRDNAGAPFAPAMFGAVRSRLADAFGGVTAYQRAPATGLWEDEDDTVQQDDLVMFEVMVESLDRGWWKRYAADLAARFRQEEILVRALPCEWL